VPGVGNDGANSGSAISRPFLMAIRIDWAKIAMKKIICFVPSGPWGQAFSVPQWWRQGVSARRGGYWASWPILAVA
jgi:hypothetical protein